MGIRNRNSRDILVSLTSGLGRHIPFRVWVLILAILTIITRLPALTSRPLWYDEAFSILFAREGPAAMVYGTLTVVDGAAADVHPLLYYNLLWVWMKIFGQSILAVRSLSVVLSVALLYALITLGRSFFSEKVGLLSGLLYAFAPFQVHYGQEARMYILLALCLTLATLSLYKAIQGKSRWHIILFGVFSALSMYSHVLAFFFLFPLAVIVLVQQFSKATLNRVIQGSVIGMILYAPWLIRLPTQISKVQQSYWINNPGLSTMLQTVIAFSGDLPVSDAFLPFLLFVSLLILIFVGIESWLLIKNRVAGVEEGVLSLSLAFLPVVLLFGVSQIWPLYIVRGLLPSAVLYLLVIAWLLYDGRKLSTWTLAICIFLAFVVGNVTHFTYAGFPYAPYSELNEHLRTQVERDSIVLHSNKLSMLPAYYDDPTLPHEYLQDPPGSGSDTLALPTQEVLGLIAESDPLEAVQDASDVFFVVFQKELEDYERLGYVQHPALSALDHDYIVTSTIVWDELLLYRMVRSK